MSAAHTYAIRMMLKAFGLNADEIEKKALQAQSVVMEFNPEELHIALKTLLDYKRNQEENEKRMLAIMDRLEIIDPCLKQEDIQNADHFI